VPFTLGVPESTRQKTNYPVDTHCCHIGKAIKHLLPDRVKPSFVFFDIQTLRRSGLSISVDYILRHKIQGRNTITATIDKFQITV